jgi:hypothetical protein
VKAQKIVTICSLQNAPRTTRSATTQAAPAENGGAQGNQRGIGSWGESVAKRFSSSECLQQIGQFCLNQIPVVIFGMPGARVACPRSRRRVKLRMIARRQWCRRDRLRCCCRSGLEVEDMVGVEEMGMAEMVGVEDSVSEASQALGCSQTFTNRTSKQNCYGFLAEN